MIVVDSRFREDDATGFAPVSPRPQSGEEARREATSGHCCPGSRAIQQQANSTGSGSNASRSRFAARGRRPGCSNRLPSSGA